MEPINAAAEDEAETLEGGDFNVVVNFDRPRPSGKRRPRTERADNIGLELLRKEPAAKLVRFLEAGGNLWREGC